MDKRMEKQKSLCSSGLRPLQGRCPKSICETVCEWLFELLSKIASKLFDNAEIQNNFLNFYHFFHNLRSTSVIPAPIQKHTIIRTPLPPLTDKISFFSRVLRDSISHFSVGLSVRRLVRLSVTKLF